MATVDDLLEMALRDQDPEILAATAEQGWFDLGISQFRGKLGWVTWVIVIVQTALFLAGAYCAYRFFGAVDILPTVKWGVSSAVLLIAALQLKLSLMPQIQADRILREVKRIELLIVSRET